VPGYRKDLAYIHDAGFRDYALNAAPGLLQILRKNGVTDGLVVDLGCGSGRWAAELNRAGYKVLGVDQSAAMIGLARKIAPDSRFKIASLLRTALPSCDAITSIGECLNYCFDEKNSREELTGLFERAHRALRPGGVLVFDIAEPARIPRSLPQTKWIEGRDWSLFVSTSGDRVHNTLQREIVCFRKLGRQYRRNQETHNLRLYRANDIVQDLARCGFAARRISGYGAFRFPPGIAGVLAIKKIQRRAAGSPVGGGAWSSFPGGPSTSVKMGFNASAQTW
jgi:SAM-dependent methyltransferase